jgi:phospholipid/cholesterol/gamma-HCH transport system ATP-binding protein
MPGMEEERGAGREPPGEAELQDDGGVRAHTRAGAHTRTHPAEEANHPPADHPPAADVHPETAATLDAAAEFEYHSEFDWDSQHGDGAWSIRCYDVHKRLGGLPVLNGLNVAIPDETVTVVLGPSGTGKSVLIKHLIGLMFPDSGDIIVHGQSVPSLPMPDLLKLRRRIGVLFQDGALFGSMSVFDNVAFPLRQHTDMSESQIRQRVRQRLMDVGLGDAMDYAPNQLSGGMRKRAGFARALVMEPDIVIFDEPDSGLDPVRTALLCELIKEMHGQFGGTYIVVTHDIASARRIGEFIALLWRGRIVEAGDAEKMFSSENPFVRQFLSGSAEGPLGMD